MWLSEGFVAQGVVLASVLAGFAFAAAAQVALGGRGAPGEGDRHATALAGIDGSFAAAGLGCAVAVGFEMAFFAAPGGGPRAFFGLAFAFGLGGSVMAFAWALPRPAEHALAPDRAIPKVAAACALVPLLGAALWLVPEFPT